MFVASKPAATLEVSKLQAGALAPLAIPVNHTRLGMRGKPCGTVFVAAAVMPVTSRVASTGK
jgi:hypothetical protein